MNYRHAFHAGNFADVLKHAVLAYCVRHLTRKEKPFWALDTHAGIGWYDLGGEAARRSPEWRDGIGRLWDAAASAPIDAQVFLSPYLDAVRAVNAGGVLKRYPGSPSIVVELARPADVIRLCELHPEDARTLALRFEADPRVTVEARDGYEAVKAQLPPKERRGLVVVDPPFEDRDEMAAMARGAKNALERWSTGTFIFWRPLKDLWSAERFDSGLAAWLIEERGFDPEKILRADLWVRALEAEGPPESDQAKRSPVRRPIARPHEESNHPARQGGLRGAGVVVINPPFGLEAGLLAALPWLSELFAQGEGAGWRLDGAITEETQLGEEPSEDN